jgi:hypothetical protein
VFIHPVRRRRPSHTMAHRASTSAVADEAAGLSRASAGLSPSGQATVPVTGILADGRPLVGHLKHITTSAVNGVVMLEATLTSPELSPGGMAIAAAIQQVTASQGCTTLTVNLGPAQINALDFVVDFAPIDLDVSAVPGSGNLRGNPLCAGLPEGGGALQDISALLNRLLNGLGL